MYDGNLFKTMIMLEIIKHRDARHIAAMEAMKEVSVAKSMLQCIRKHGIVNLRKLNPLSCLGRRLSTKKVKLLPWLSCEAHSLLKGDPTLRLGSWTRGCHDIKNHKWVNEIASES
ncbi:uncharacterized protein LOC118480436 isoform X2 [Helianthus annuus]|uniref:uncharacterized protein LOC118480436 isoform X2 n=1 Tax=Helianthus annuus TaxID=4232 RepID=UPI001652DE0C|nr:uncharacterized protein LOC118480436 isoform X2 [Helianthus annuus]